MSKYGNVRGVRVTNLTWLNLTDVPKKFKVSIVWLYARLQEFWIIAFTGYRGQLFQSLRSDDFGIIGQWKGRAISFKTNQGNSDKNKWQPYKCIQRLGFCTILTDYITKQTFLAVELEVKLSGRCVSRSTPDARNIWINWSSSSQKHYTEIWIYPTFQL